MAEYSINVDQIYNILLSELESHTDGEPPKLKSCSTDKLPGDISTERVSGVMTMGIFSITKVKEMYANIHCK